MTEPTVMPCGFCGAGAKMVIESLLAPAPRGYRMYCDDCYDGAPDAGDSKYIAVGVDVPDTIDEWNEHQRDLLCEKCWRPLNDHDEVECLAAQGLTESAKITTMARDRKDRNAGTD